MHDANNQATGVAGQVALMAHRQHSSANCFSKYNHCHTPGNAHCSTQSTETGLQYETNNVNGVTISW